MKQKGEGARRQARCTTQARSEQTWQTPALPAPRSPANLPLRSGGLDNTYGMPALGKHGSGRVGVLSQYVSRGEPPALSRLHTRGAERVGAATPAGRLPSAAGKSEGKAPLNVPAAVTSFDRGALCCCCSGENCGYPEETNGPHSGRSQRSAHLWQRCGRWAAPTAPGRGTTGPDRAGSGERSAASAAASPPFERISFLGLASCRCNPKAGNPIRRQLLSPLLPLAKRGKSTRLKWDSPRRDCRKPRGREKVFRECHAPGRRRRGQVLGKTGSDEQEEGGRRRRKGAEERRCTANPGRSSSSSTCTKRRRTEEGAPQMQQIPPLLAVRIKRKTKALRIPTGPIGQAVRPVAG